MSIISKIETLGYHRLSTKQKALLENFFQSINILKLDDAVVEQAIQLRQKENIPLGDAIIGATAIHFNTYLVTRNIKDFTNIAGLKIINPFASESTKK